MKDTEVSTEKELQKIVQDPSCLVVIDCYATWCGPCKVLGKEIDKFASEYSNEKVLFVKVNVDEPEFENFASLNKISALPTVLYVKGDKVVDSFKGNQIDKFKAYVAKYAPTD